MLRTLIRLSSVLALVLIASVGAVIYYGAKPGPHKQAERIWVKPGMSVGQAARAMEKKGVLYDAILLELAVRVSGAVVRAGEYEIPVGASSFDILDILRSGDPILHQLTIPEGLTSAEIVERINGAEVLDGEIAELPEEGSLLPETYKFERGTSRQALIERMKRAQKNALTALWETRVAHPGIATQQDAIILASIVEKETGIGSERGMVASVFLNRLKRGMKLDADPTVIYAVELEQGKPLDRPLMKADLKLDSPYNTYVSPGLPPGPIANPGRAAIAAVLQPIESKALYFVADGTGGHVFADSLAEHNRNVAKWRKIQRQNR